MNTQVNSEYNGKIFYFKYNSLKFKSSVIFVLKYHIFWKLGFSVSHGLVALTDEVFEFTDVCAIGMFVDERYLNNTV